MKKSVLKILGVICGILFVASSHPACADVVVQTDKPQYTTGDDVVITVRNELTEPIYYLGMCALSDCLLEDDTWRCEESNCDAPQEVLLAGEEKTFHIQVVGLIVGDMKYRFEYTTAILERFSHALSNDFFIISTGEPERMSIAEQVQQFPQSDQSTTSRFIAVGSGRSQRRDNRYIARNFKNQDLPGNQEVIQQRKRQDKLQTKSTAYGLAENEVIVSVSGVPKPMRQAIINVLTNEYPFIQAMEEVSYDKRVVQYFIQMEINAEEFADRLRTSQFSSFRLDVIRSNSNHIDCTLKFN